MGNKMNVLSLFDGISCGQLALQRVGIPINQYFASEIDKHAIKVTQTNFPNTIQLGSVVDVKAENLPKIDILLAGSPCQGFSFAGKQLNFEDPRSKLFFEFVRLLKECTPKYFLLENVKMKKEHENVISEILGVVPIKINSALVSPQNRQRLYWTNIPGICQPEDKGILLKNILVSGFTEREKSFCLLASGNPSNRPAYKRRYLNKSIGNLKLKIPESETNKGNIFDNLEILSPIEWERLQTVPDNYTSCISNNKRYHALGNGWTVDVIAHIIKGIIC
jgi:site-specific DNA-cytosine methylase